MLQLGDLLIRNQEVREIAGHRGRLGVVLAWKLDELPLILGLVSASDLHLSWHHPVDDPVAGIPVRLVRWEYRSGREERGRLRLVLEPVEGAGVA